MKVPKYYRSRKIANSSEQFVLAARKMDHFLLAESQIFLSLALFAFGNFEKQTYQAKEKRQKTFQFIGTLKISLKDKPISFLRGENV